MTASVVLLATTNLYRERFEYTPYTQHPFPSEVETVMAADELAEFAARSRHQTWDRGGGYLNADYLKSLLIRREFSFFEHASATFWITGVSVAFASDLKDHRDLVITEGSYRYRVPPPDGFVTPYLMRWEDPTDSTAADAYDDGREDFIVIVDELRRKGFRTHQAHEAARAVLPQCTETTLVVTGNMMAWRRVLKRSTAEDTSAEMRAVITQIYRGLDGVAPHSVSSLLRLTDDNASEPEPRCENYNECGNRCTSQNECDDIRSLSPAIASALSSAA